MIEMDDLTRLVMEIQTIMSEQDEAGHNPLEIWAEKNGIGIETLQQATTLITLIGIEQPIDTSMTVEELRNQLISHMMASTTMGFLLGYETHQQLGDRRTTIE